MSLAVTIRAMAAAGCTAQQIADVVEAIERAAAAQTADRRARDAARKRRSRARTSADGHAMSRDVTRTSADTADAASPSSSPPHPPNNYPSPPTPSGPVGPSGVDPRAASAREPADARLDLVPDDWTPSQADRIHAELRGVPADMVDRVADEFAAHSRANRRGYATPSAGFRLWLSRQHRFDAPTPRARSPSAPDQDRSVSDAAMRLIQNGYQLGPRPQSAAERLGLVAGRPDVGLFPAGGCDAPGDVRRSGGGGAERLSAGHHREGH